MKNESDNTTETKHVGEYPVRDSAMTHEQIKEAREAWIRALKVQAYRSQFLNAAACAATHLPAALDTIEALNREIERLRGIVERLPTTADGVPIVPGMKIWSYEFASLGDDPQSRTICNIGNGYAYFDHEGGFTVEVNDLYSTRESALAAAQSELAKIGDTK